MTSGLDSAGDWQPIETAPKDGSPVWLLTRDPEESWIGRWNATGTSWTDDGELAITGTWLSCGGWFEPNEVTHWKPVIACPVCGFPGLSRPAAGWEICPCCGTEFGYDDANRSYAELRRRWIEDGCEWFALSCPAPEGWNAQEQLEKAGFADER